MSNNAWNAPVAVDFPHQEQKVIGSPFEAMTCLTDRWPNMSGVKFLRARLACKAALDGRLSADDARVIFVEAVSEAGGRTH